MEETDALRKYSLRGFNYIPWPTDKNGAHDASYQSQSITDTPSMIIDTEDITWEVKSYQEISGESSRSWMSNDASGTP